MITPTTVFSGLDGAVGCDYLLSKNQLILVEFDGDIDLINLSNNSHQIIGTGYQNLEDIKISRDGLHAYVTERQGNLLRVDLAHPNRASATVVSSGMTAPHQIFLDEDRRLAYVVEFAPSGRILRIDLNSATPATNHTPIASGLRSAVGLLMSADREFAYVSEQTGGAITRIRLSTGNRQTLVSGLVQPFFLTWLGDNETTILTTERDPANKVVLIDLTQTPATRTEIATVPTRPSSVVVVGPDQVYVCSDQVVSRLSLTGYGPTAPIFMGIGHVPASKIGATGMATTDPGYFFQVVDAPFGGSLPIMINHVAARDTLHAAHYRILVDGVELPVTPFNDYRWNSGTSQFVLVPNPQPPGPFYTVRAAGEVWYNPWLGAFVDSTKLSNGLHTIAVRLFNAANVEIGHVTDVGRFVKVLIDNGLPIASIDRILHNGVEVPVCAIEHLGTDNWTFQITARDPEKHLKNWSLWAVWGDNKSKGVAFGAYVHNVAGTWEGLPPDPNTVPNASSAPPPLTVPWHAFSPGDTSSTNCAHTFFLGVWDRVIDGWNYIHYSDYHKSITIIP
jgi:sugar lactone lactonase YvrE